MEDPRKSEPNQQPPLAVAIQAVPEAVVVADAAGRIVSLNDAARRLLALPADAAGLRPLGEWERLDPGAGAPGESEPVEALRKALTGEATPDAVTNITAGNGAPLRVRFSAAPVRDPQGEITHAILIGRDVTAEQRVADYWQAIGTAARGLATEMQLDRVLDTVLDQITAALGGDVVIGIWLLSADGGRLILQSQRGLTPVSLEQVRDIPLDCPSIICAAAEERRVRYMEDTETAAERAELDDLVVRNENLGSWIATPLLAGDKLLGSFSYGMRLPRRFSAEDLGAVTVVAGFFATAIDHALLYEEAQADSQQLRRLSDELVEMNERLVISSVREQELAEGAEQARRRFAFLAAAGTRLAASLEYETTLQETARLVVPELADWAVVDMLEPGGEIRRVAVAHADPARAEEASQLQQRPPQLPASESPMAQVLRSGRSLRVSRVDEAWLAKTASSPERLALLRALGVESLLCVPLIARGHIRGALTLVSARPERRYDADDLIVAEELARDAALAVDNAWLYQSQRRIALTLQSSLLPAGLPLIRGLDLAARYHPAAEGLEVGGDFYDVFELPDDAWAIVIGDVVGKGVDAAVLTSLCRYTLRAVATRRRRPSGMLQLLNAAIMEQVEYEESCTVVCARLKVTASGARVTLANGGHPPPYLVRADGRVEQAGRFGMLLGVVPDPDLADATVTLSPGDCLLLYTDGATEGGSGGDLFGEERLAALLRECAGLSAGEVVARVEQAVLEFQSGTPRDDIALLAVRLT